MTVGGADRTALVADLRERLTILAASATMPAGAGTGATGATVDPDPTMREWT